ncbi:aspartate carbamoyltransferase catalytic subunit [Thalassococcus sp. BH17M4-6]|uniref:aspartate carbamoyltransferase catalytic subunit n=1 Tax=Thalassococcus sp. BH17M4-6 TaxID=3413148 RepID=UPI003BE96178
MTTMEISEYDADTTRVFHLDLPPEAIERYTGQAGTGEWPLQYGLGAKKLRPAFVEIVTIRDLGDMPLSTYLSEGYGLSGEDFRADRARLDALRGHVVILTSQAFDRTAQTLSIQSPLRWIGTYTDTSKTPVGEPLRSESAKGTLAGGSPAVAGARGSSGVLKLVLAVVGVILLAVIIYAISG